MKLYCATIIIRLPGFAVVSTPAALAVQTIVHSAECVTCYIAAEYRSSRSKTHCLLFLFLIFPVHAISSLTLSS